MTFSRINLISTSVKVVQKRTGESLSLIVDNCSAQRQTLPNIEGVECVELPPKVTSICQEMDQNVLNAMKRHARRGLLRKIINNLENRAQLHLSGDLQNHGLRGIRNGRSEKQTPSSCFGFHRNNEAVRQKVGKETDCQLLDKIWNFSSNHIDEICNNYSRNRFQNLHFNLGFKAD